MPREGKDVSGHLLGLLGRHWVDKEHVLKEKKDSMGQTSDFIELLSNCFHLCFCMENTQVSLGLKGVDYTGTRNAAVIAQGVSAQQEALLEQDHKYSKKRFPDTHLGILIMNKCP